MRERIFEPFFTAKFTGARPWVAGGARDPCAVTAAPSRFSRSRARDPLQALLSRRGRRAPGLSRPVRVSKIWQATGRILVIDDEEIVRNVTSRLLRSFGFTTLLAADGIDGVITVQATLARGDRACLLDLTMPRAGREAVFRQLGRSGPTCPVLLMSGYNEQEAISRFESKGLAGFSAEAIHGRAARRQVAVDSRECLRDSQRGSLGACPSRGDLVVARWFHRAYGQPLRISRERPRPRPWSHARRHRDDRGRPPCVRRP